MSILWVMLAEELKMGGDWRGRSHPAEAHHTITSAGRRVMMIDEGFHVGDGGI